MQVSSELQSQLFNKWLIADLLYKNDRLTWTKNHSRHELIIIPWATGLWVKQAGLVSYHALAEALRYEAEAKAYNLSVRTYHAGYLVSSQQEANKNYFVDCVKGKWQCNCMRYRCWKNRMHKELPQLYKALDNKIFCHHIVAAYNYTKQLKTKN
ncbi:hypothetical protein BV378_20320 [Nostoc sp. RF31YmG]|jgi:hypothetical protein|nr:hypothetical protein BV378_20320 [Nostoc sp. RF31YmG]